MPYYEYEYVVKNLIDILKEKQDAEEGQQKEMGNTDQNSMMKKASSMMPKMPSMPSMPGTSFPSIPSSLKI